MKTPEVSIVLPSFNRLTFLRKAIKSVLAQTFENWELIVVDDGSDPATLAWLREQRDARIRLLERPHSGNPAAVRNAGIAIATAMYLAFLDSDDVWTADRLAQQLETLRRLPQRRWSYCKTRMIDSNDNLLPESGYRAWRSCEGAIAEALLRREASVATASVIAERTLVDEAGGFDARLLFAEHYDLWVRLAMRSEVSVCPQTLVHIRTHDENYTRDRIATANGWCAFYSHNASRIPNRHLRAVCREMHGIAALELARKLAANRDWPAVARPLFSAMRFGMRHASWWRSLAIGQPGSRR